MSDQVAKAYLLSIELHGPQGQTLPCVVPCMEGDFIRWLAASNRRLDSKRLRKLIRSNPALFLLAISRAADCSGQQIQSMVQLLSRLDHCFCETDSDSLDTALGHVAEIAIDSADFLAQLPMRAAISEFHQAKKRKGLVKSLSRFIRRSNKRYTCKSRRTSNDETRKFLKSVLDQSFRAGAAKKQAPSQREQLLDQTASATIESLLCERQKRSSEFDTCLQQSKLAAMKQLAYGASHEINNPLANIATRAQTLLAAETEPDRRFQLAVVHEQAMRAHDMISDMMLFAHPPKLNLQTTDVRLFLSQIVRNCAANLGCLVRSKTQLTASVASNVNVASFDRQHCGVALESLVQNAAEAIVHDQGEIHIHVSQTETDIVFSVSDNGSGVEEHAREHLFDPFFSGREAGRGLGFGLSKSWRIAELHGGTLTHYLDSKSTNTVFQMKIPR